MDLRKGDVIASAETLPFRDESFDSVGCGEVIEHLRSPQSCIDEIRRVLKGDGTAVLTTPNLGTLFHGASFLENPEHINCLDHSRLVSMLGGFREVRRHGFDVFLEAPLHGWAGAVPYSVRRAFAQRARSAVAVDISPEMLRKVQDAATRASVTNIQFIQSDGRRLQLGDRSADKVLLVRVYHEVQEHEAVLREFGRVLRPEGRLILVERVKKGLLPGPPVQDPGKLKEEVESSGLFRLQSTLPRGGLSVLIFGKSA